MCRQKMFLRYGNLPNTVMTVANVEAKIKGHSGCRGKGGRFKKKKKICKVSPSHLFKKPCCCNERATGTDAENKNECILTHVSSAIKHKLQYKNKSVI